MKFLKFWFPVVLYCCIIFGASAVETVPTTPNIPYLDKVIHGFEYAILAVLTARAMVYTNPKAWTQLVWVIVVFFVAFYGITDEFHQSYVPGRSSDLADLLADIIGGAVGSAIYLWWQVKYKRNKIRG